MEVFSYEELTYQLDLLHQVSYSWQLLLNLKFIGLNKISQVINRYQEHYLHRGARFWSHLYIHLTIMYICHFLLSERVCDSQISYFLLPRSSAN